MKTNLKGIAFLLLPICVVLGCESKKPVAETHVQSKIQATARLGPPPEVIYVGGESKNPGKYPRKNGLTLQDSVDAAGGFNHRARRQFVIIHWDGPGSYWQEAGKGRPTNPVLEPGDKIRTPRD